MEHGTSWGTWMAYGAICTFLLVMLIVLARTMLLFATLTFMPVSRAMRWLRRLARVGRSRES